jgi:hypothetical protein
VLYSEFAVSGGSFSKTSEHSCSQMQFLHLLIQGEELQE